MATDALKEKPPKAQIKEQKLRSVLEGKRKFELDNISRKIGHTGFGRLKRDEHVDALINASERVYPLVFPSWWQRIRKWVVGSAVLVALSLFFEVWGFVGDILANVRLDGLIRTYQLDNKYPLGYAIFYNDHDIRRRDHLEGVQIHWDETSLKAAGNEVCLATFADVDNEKGAAQLRINKCLPKEPANVVHFVTLGGRVQLVFETVVDDNGVVGVFGLRADHDRGNDNVVIEAVDDGVRIGGSVIVR